MQCECVRRCKASSLRTPFGAADANHAMYVPALSLSVYLFESHSIIIYLFLSTCPQIKVSMQTVTSVLWADESTLVSAGARNGYVCTSTFH
jgi:hypothetical protein